MDKIEFAFAWNIVENVLKNRDQISSQLKKTTIKIQKRSLMTIQRAVEILSS